MELVEETADEVLLDELGVVEELEESVLDASDPRVSITRLGRDLGGENNVSRVLYSETSREELWAQKMSRTRRYRRLRGAGRC